MSGLAPTGRNPDNHQSAHLLAGVAGGVSFWLIAGMAAQAIKAGFWIPMNMVGAVLFPELRPLTGAFDLQASVTGMVLHLYISAFWGLVFGFVVDALGAEESLGKSGLLGCGAVFGFIVWLVMGRLIGPLFAPELAYAPALPFIVIHMVFGVRMAWALHRLVHHVEVAPPKKKGRRPVTKKAARPSSQRRP